MRLLDRLPPARALLAGAVCCLLAAGCSGSSTGTPSEPEKKAVEPEKKPIKPNFGKINGRMLEQDVLDLLGKSDTSVDVEPKSPKHEPLSLLTVFRTESGVPTVDTGLAYVDPKKVLDILAQDDKPDVKPAPTVKPDVKPASTVKEPIPPGSELVDTAAAIIALNQSYHFSGQTDCTSSTAGSSLVVNEKLVVKTWKEGDTTYVVVFRGGKVLAKGPGKAELAKEAAGSAAPISQAPCD